MVMTNLRTPTRSYKKASQDSKGLVLILRGKHLWIMLHLNKVYTVHANNKMMQMTI